MRAMKRRVLSAALGAVVSASLVQGAAAHHSFAMYDVGKTYVMTGIVTLQMSFVGRKEKAFPD